jgi:HEAT repeat protein
MVNLDLFSSRLPNVEALKAKQDIKGLIRLLDRRNIDTQWQSADALGSLGTIATLPLLAALNHRKTAVWLGAIETLGTFRDQRSCKPLQKRVRALLPL